MTNTTLEEFIKKSKEERLISIILLFNNLHRTITHLSLEKDELYCNGKSLMESTARLLNLSLDDIIKNPKNYEEIIPVEDSTYESYIKNREGRGILTEIGVTEEVYNNGKICYKLSSFGELTKGFISYVLKRFIELGINPQDILNVNKSNKVSNKLKIIEYIVKNKENTSIKSITKNINAKAEGIRYDLEELKDYGLIKYEEPKNLDEYYKINRKEAIKIYKNIYRKDNYEIREYIKEKADYGRFNLKVLKRVIRDIVKSKEPISNIYDLVKKYEKNERTIKDIISVLVHLKILEGKDKNFIIKPTEKLLELYNLIEEIKEVSENPFKLYNYKDYSLNKEEISKLINLYINSKRYKEEKINRVLEVLKEYKKLSIEELSQHTGYDNPVLYYILRKLKNKGLVKNEKYRYWYYKDSNHI
ncbi:hypothetical protein YN1_7640 [Nanoarchaeota archaeon]